IVEARSDGGRLRPGRACAGSGCTPPSRDYPTPRTGTVPMPCEERIMRSLRRFGGAMVLLLSTVGVICCVTGAIGVWIFYQHACQRVQNITARLDVGLERASVANQNAQRAVGKARAEVAKVGKESTDLGGSGERTRGASRALRTLIQQQVGPN